MTATVIQVHPSYFNPQAQVCADCEVRRFALFGVLDAQALDQIHVHIADLHLQPGQSLYTAQSQGAAAYTVRSGVMRLERSSERGERRVLRLAGRSDMLGLEAMLGQRYAADAVACTEVRLCRIPRTLVEDLSRGHPELLLDLMKRWQRALDDADEWLTELCAGPARHRMLRLLLKLSEYTEGDQVWLPARLDMSAMLDVTIETASRLISQLKREGVLSTPDQRHAVLHMPALIDALRREQASGS